MLGKTCHAVEALPLNQGRGGLEQMNDEVAETDQLSGGPVLSRLLFTMRFEHRPSPNRRHALDCHTNSIGEGSTNSFTNPAPIVSDNSLGGLEEASPYPSCPPATFMPESSHPSWKKADTKLDSQQLDERLKAELRHLGFLEPETEPDYDAHYDDEIAERLRILQAEFKRVSIANCARKARVLELAKEHMAYHEYSKILEGLNTQIQEAYSKSTPKKGRDRKGTAAELFGAEIVGESTRKLLTVRKDWIEKVGVIFNDDCMRVRGSEDDIFGEEEMEPLMEVELQKWGKEAEEDELETSFGVGENP